MNTALYLYRWAMWALSRIFVVLYLRQKYNFTRSAGSDPFPKPPFILIANHGTFFDPWMACYGSWSPIALMCNDDAFRGNPIAGWYLRSIGAFPKKKGSSDFKAMKTTMGLLKAKYPVCIFPEGQTTWDGETQLIHRGIERILKKVGCSLVAVRLQGNFLTKAWWARTVRKGRILVTTKVLTPEVISGMSADDLFRRMKELIYQNEIRDPDNLSVPFQGTDLALGLERFVWMCMQCEAEDRLVTNGDTVACGACGGCWRIDAHCRLTPQKEGLRCLPDLKAWADWHRERVLQRLGGSASTSPLTDGVIATLRTEDEKKVFVNRGSGTLLLTRETLSFDPVDRNGMRLSVPIEKIGNFVIQQKDIFECTVGDQDYRFAFDGHSPMKWIYYLRYLKGYRECELRGYLE